MGGHTANRVETQHRVGHTTTGAGGCTAHELVTARGNDTTLVDTAHEEGNTAHKSYISWGGPRKTDDTALLDTQHMG